MKHVLLLLGLLLPIFRVVAGEPWPGVKYTEVRAYAWDPAKMKDLPEELIRADMSFVDGVMNKEGAVLKAEQVKRLLKAEARRFIARPVAGCYMPHNAFVFYDEKKKPVAFLEICFDCIGSRSSPPDSDCDPDFVELARLCSELKLPFGKTKTLKEFEENYRSIFEPPADAGGKPK